MPTNITKTIKRQIKLHGIEKPINLSITPHGVEMAVIGFHKRVFASWEHIAKNLLTPADSPSFVFGKPWEFLQHQSNVLRMKTVKKAQSLEAANEKV